MDYKYIEQLLERYWDCGTSLEEEQILRSFFRQRQLPGHLLRYRELFAALDEEKRTGLGEDFDARVLALVERPVVKARRLTLRQRCMPLLKAVAMVVILLATGALMKRSVSADSGMVCAGGVCGDSTCTPQVAYQPLVEADTVAGDAQMPVAAP